MPDGQPCSKTRCCQVIHWQLRTSDSCNSLIWLWGRTSRKMFLSFCAVENEIYRSVRINSNVMIYWLSCRLALMEAGTTQCSLPPGQCRVQVRFLTLRCVQHVTILDPLLIPGTSAEPHEGIEVRRCNIRDVAAHGQCLNSTSHLRALEPDASPMLL